MGLRFIYDIDGWVGDPELDQGVLAESVRFLARINCQLLRRLNARGVSLPSVYSSGVRYVRDEKDVWRDCLNAYSRGAADCKSLIAWRIGELWYANAPADVGITWTRDGERWLYHVTAKTRNGEEDVSRTLGMRLA